MNDLRQWRRAMLGPAGTSGLSTSASDNKAHRLKGSLAVIPSYLEANTIANLAALKIWIVLYMNEDINGAIVWGDKAKPLVHKETAEVSSA